MRRVLLLLGVPPLLCLLAAYATCAHVRYGELAPRLDDAARTAALAPLRLAVDGQPFEKPTHPALNRSTWVVASVWSLGRRVARAEGHGKTLADSLQQAAQALLDDGTLQALDVAERHEARIQVDVVRGEAPLVDWLTATSALGVVPGLDGVKTTNGKVTATLLPDELVEHKLLGSMRLLPMVPEFRVGLDLEHADALLGSRAGIPGWAGGARRHRRFRTDTFVEQPATHRELPPIPLTRGKPPAPALTAENLREAARLGGEYLVAHLHENGRYYYEVDLTTGKASDPTALGAGYNLPRHAGTSYFLSELYAENKTPELSAALVRAFDHLVYLIGEGGCKGTTPAGRPFQCVIDKGQRQASMGSTALATIAIAEYRLASGDPRYDETLRAMAEWIVMLHKPNGKFAHLYDVPTHTPDWDKELLYYDGEAALALIRSYKVFGDERYLRAAEKALDALVTTYDFFAGQFFFGEEHWTCIAAEAGWPELQHDRYREFCSDYARFLRAQQFDAAEFPGQEDLAGAYSVTPFFVPHNTPAGSRTEAMISAWLLSKYHGRPEEAIRRQVLASVRYMLGQQVRDDWFTPAMHARGAMTTSATDRNVRIDYVQHTCSAMLRAAELVEWGNGKK